MKRYCLYIIVIITTLVLFSWASVRLFELTYPGRKLVEHTPDINLRHHIAIDEQQPEMVLLGNSIMYDNVDDILIADTLSLNTYKIPYPASTSALWYLIIKNVLGEIDHKPQYLLITFRDAFLTFPHFRINTPDYQDMLEEFTHAEEPLLDKLAYLNDTPWIERQLLTYLPVYTERSALKEIIEAQFKFLIPTKFMGYSKQEVDAAISRTFDNSQMDPDLVTSYQLLTEEAIGEASFSRIYQFNEIVDQSFLPHIIQLTRENDIQLILVRSKRVRDAELVNEPDDLQIYIQDLQKYLDTEDVYLIDLTYAPEILPEHFGEGDHLTQEGNQVFTELLIQSLKPILNK